MKRLILFLIFTIAALFAVSCQKEFGSQDNKEKLVFSTIKVGVEDGGMTSDDPGTKSLIDVDTENFYDAYIFAFDASNKKILNYEDGTPVSVYTTSKTFEWSLPVGTAMDVWVVANAGTGNTWKSTLESALSNANLTESDLYGDNLMFSCTNGSALAAMEHMPMAGMMNDVTLATSSDVLTLRIKRLFAKYEIRLIPDALKAEGFDVKSLFVSSSKVNTEVPFFYNGDYKQTSSSKLAVVDRAREEELVDFEEGRAITLYFLENCQGDKGPASNWSKVYQELGSDVALCSYVEIGVNCVRESTGQDESIIYRLYLSNTDFKSNFDVKRNIRRKVAIRIYPDGPKPSDGFKFTNPSPVILQPGGSQAVPFETSIDNDHKRDISFEFFDNDGNSTSNLSINGKPTLTTNSTNVTTYGYQGSVTVKATSSCPVGKYSVKGGNGNLSDKADIQVTNNIPGYFEMRIFRGNGACDDNYKLSGYDDFRTYRYLGFEILSYPNSNTSMKDYYNDGNLTASTASSLIPNSLGHKYYGSYRDVEYIVLKDYNGVEHKIYVAPNSAYSGSSTMVNYIADNSDNRGKFQHHLFYRVDLKPTNSAYSTWDMNSECIGPLAATAWLGKCNAVRFKLKDYSTEYNVVRDVTYNPHYQVKLIPYMNHRLDSGGGYWAGLNTPYYAFTISTVQDGPTAIPAIEYDGKGTTCTVDGVTMNVADVISFIEIYQNSAKTKRVTLHPNASKTNGVMNFLGAVPEMQPDYYFAKKDGESKTVFYNGYGNKTVESYGMFMAWQADDNFDNILPFVKHTSGLTGFWKTSYGLPIINFMIGFTTSGTGGYHKMCMGLRPWVVKNDVSALYM